jgi:YHS domain-containing protein
MSPTMGIRRRSSEMSEVFAVGLLTAAKSTQTMRGDEMVKDPVCGMDVDPSKAAAKSQHNGVTYYFCAQSCKQKFDQKPDQFVKKVS